MAPTKMCSKEVNKMKNFIIVLILYSIFTIKGYTEINYLDYQLGMSQQTLYEQLTKDRFYFPKFLKKP